MTSKSNMAKIKRPSRILHTMLRVTDLERSLYFYQNILGMKVFSQQDYSEARFTLIFLGYGDDKLQPAIELTYNWDNQKYQLGNGYGHIALEVEDIFQFHQQLIKQGVIVLREPAAMSFIADNSKQSDVIAFIEDPDGYTIELIQA